MLRFSCPHCHSVLQIADHLSGHQVACGTCRQILHIPAPVQPAPPPLPAMSPASVAPSLPPPPPLPPQLSKAAPPRRSLATVGLWSLPILLILAVIGVSFFLAGRLGRTPAPAPPGTSMASDEKQPPQEIAPGEKAPGDVKKPAADPIPPDLAEKILAALNEPRRAADLPPVTLDAALSAGCRAHARYLVHNAEVLEQRGTNPHDEDPNLPEASAEGRQAAASAHIDERAPLATIAAWLEAPAHRDLLLSPRLRAIGWGMVRTGDRAISVFSLPRTDPEEPNGAVLYPADGQVEVPLAFTGTETPDPLPETEDKTAGYPLTATFPRQTKVTGVSVHLEDEAGRAVPVWLSSPEHPANPEHPSVQQHSVCVLAREPLRPGTHHVVRLAATVNKASWQTTWSFTTSGRGATKRDLTAGVLRRINARRKQAKLPAATLDSQRSRACAAHAAYLFRNFARLPSDGLRTEQAAFPGYTEEGKRIGNRSWIAIEGDEDDVIRLLLSSIYFRYQMLNPGLRSVAIGHAPSLIQGHLWVVDLGDVGAVRVTNAALLYPADGEKDVPTAYLAEEEPRPVPDRDKIGGVAVTAFLISASPVRGAKAKLTDEAGQEVPSWLLSAEKPIIPSLAPTLVGLVPKEPLKPGATYRVQMSARVDGEPWSRSWSFTTAEKPYAPPQDELEAGALHKVNEVRKRVGLNPVALDRALSSGCLAHARYLLRNWNEAAVQGLGVHKEDPRLPGATEAGARAAQGIIGRTPNPTAAVDGWMATPFHRIPLLAPDLKRIGFAAVRDPRTRSWEVVLDTANGR